MRGNVLKIVLVLTIFVNTINLFANKYFYCSVISLYKDEVYLRELQMSSKRAVFVLTLSREGLDQCDEQSRLY